MNIIVCIKQVPDTETQIKIAADKQSIVSDDIKWVMNPYDEFGVEEALRLKEKHGGEVTVIGLGPKRVTESLRTALAMGADKAILIADEALNGSDSLGQAKALAAAIKQIDYDLIFTGQRGVDDDLGIVGSTIAELLNIHLVQAGAPVLHSMAQLRSVSQALRAHHYRKSGSCRFSCQLALSSLFLLLIKVY